MKRIGLQPAPLVIVMDRCPDSESPRDPAHDVIELSVWRDELRIVCTEVARNEALECGDDQLSLSEQAQVSAALIAEWLDWKPSDIGDAVASETILDVFENLKRSLVDAGVVKGEVTNG